LPSELSLDYRPQGLEIYFLFEYQVKFLNESPFVLLFYCEVIWYHIYQDLEF